MKTYRLRWALLCVAATYGAVLTSNAQASQTVSVKPGDSIDSLARKHGVSWKDIAKANGITRETVLKDGRKLVIPDPPKAVQKPATMRKAAVINDDRVSVRIGPDKEYRRLTLLDHSAPVTVTRQAGEWAQVELENGKSGWVLSSFVAISGSKAVAAGKSGKAVASRSDNSGSSKKRQIARNTDDEIDRPRKKRGSSREVSRSRNKKSKKTQVAKRRYNSKYASRRYGRSGRPEPAIPDASSNEVVRTALAYRGTRYRYGGTGSNGFDCSGFTSHVYNRKGVSLPHRAAEQYGKGQKVASNSMKKGDLVFFSTTRRGISHVGIYAGEGKFVHASSGGGRVRVDSLTSGYYKNAFRGARRVVKEAPKKETKMGTSAPKQSESNGEANDN